MANQMGKRYTCAECEATVLVTKAGDGELSCHGAGDGDRPGQAAPVLRLTTTHAPSSQGGPVNIAMILEMAADALGDRVAYRHPRRRPHLRGLCARPRAASPTGSTAPAPSASRSSSPTRPIVPATLFGAAWAGRELRTAQLPAPRRAARGAARAASSPRSSPRRTGSTPRATQRPRLPRRARRSRGAAVHQRHVGRAEGRGPRARPAARVRVQHARVRVGR